MITFVYSPRFEAGEYDHDPAAARERFDGIARHFATHLEFIEPGPAPMEAILRAHGEAHVESIARDAGLHEMAALAAGGAITAARLAWNGTPAFAVIRPPGHHASRHGAWGFCFYNNMAIALLDLMHAEGARNAFILDFDLHVGDGNINILSPLGTVEIYNPTDGDRVDYITSVERTLAKAKACDILAVSAGFDQYINDWGRCLTTGDFRTIGELCARFSARKCKGRRFALLEGGYNYTDLMDNILAFCEGFG